MLIPCINVGYGTRKMHSFADPELVREGDQRVTLNTIAEDHKMKVRSINIGECLQQPIKSLFRPQSSRSQNVADWKR